MKLPSPSNREPDATRTRPSAATALSDPITEIGGDWTGQCHYLVVVLPESPAAGELQERQRRF